MEDLSLYEDVVRRKECLNDEEAERWLNHQEDFSKKEIKLIVEHVLNCMECTLKLYNLSQKKED